MKNKYNPFSICFLLLLSFSSCRQKLYLKRIETYFNASSVEKKRSIWHTITILTLQKKRVRARIKHLHCNLLKWDAPLHPDIEILNYTVDENKWTINFNEQNDFTKPIHFPGWKAKEIITINKKGFIKEAIYIPDPANPSYRKWLQPAVEWLQKNMPDSLNDIYQNCKLIQTEITAVKWVRLLKHWRETTTK